MRITVFDEDQSQRALLLDALTAAAHACEVFADAKALLSHLRRDKIDLLILHGSLTQGGGIDLLPWVREQSSAVPVLFISHAANQDDILAALSAGITDYVIKPLRRADLLARVEVQLRRAYPSYRPAEHDQFGKYLFDSRAARLTMDDKAIALTQKEFELALFLFRNIGRPLSRATIQEAVWAQEIDFASRTIDTHISRVRSKLALQPTNGYKLAPVYSYGYQLEKTTT
jgi:DNA-binding response OmpR family regulator